MADQELFQYFPISASTLISPAYNTAVRLGGVLVTSSTGGTIKIYDGQDNTGRVAVAQMSVVAGQAYPMPILLKNGCYVEVTGTLTATVMANM